jgi:hypothetical protein
VQEGEDGIWSIEEKILGLPNCAPFEDTSQCAYWSNLLQLKGHIG